MRTRIALLCMFVFFTMTLLSSPICAQEKYNWYSYKDNQTGLAAFQLLIPDGWRFQGGITWLPKPYKISEMRFSVHAPDNSAGFDVYPDFSYLWSQNPQVNQWYGQSMSVLQPRSAVDWLQQNIIPEYRKGVQNLQVVKSRSLPDTAQEMYNAAMQLARNNPVYGQLVAGTRLSVDVGVVEISYSYQGQEYYEIFVAKINYTTSMDGQTTFWGPEIYTSFWTLASQTQPMLGKYVVMASSLAPNPVFQQKLYEINLAMVRNFQQQIANIGELSRYISQTSNEINEMIRSNYEYKNRVEDKVFSNFSDYIRSIDRFKDGEISMQVPAGYEQAWRNGDQVILSNDPNFNPNVQFQGNWNPMQKVR